MAELPKSDSGFLFWELSKQLTKYKKRKGYKKMVKLNWKTKQGQKGVAMIEYALLASLIALGVIVAITAMSGQLGTLFTTIKNSL